MGRQSGDALPPAGDPPGRSSREALKLGYLLGYYCTRWTTEDGSPRSVICCRTGAQSIRRVQTLGRWLIMSLGRWVDQVLGAAGEVLDFCQRGISERSCLYDSGLIFCGYLWCVTLPVRTPYAPLQELAFWTPGLCLLTGLLVCQLCEKWREKIRAVAKVLDPQTTVADNWQLHPPGLQSAYERWCCGLRSHQMLQYLSLAMNMMGTYKLTTKEGVGLIHFTYVGSFVTMSLVRLPLLRIRFSSTGFASVFHTWLVLRVVMLAYFFIVQDPVVISSGSKMVQSYSTTMAATAACVTATWVQVPVPMEHSYTLVAGSSLSCFSLSAYKFHMQHEEVPKGLGDINAHAVLACFLAAALAGQVTLAIRQAVGATNMTRFLVCQLDSARQAQRT